MSSLISFFKSPSSAYVYVFFGTFLFSSKAIYVKLMLPQGLDPLSILFLRMLFSLPIFLLLSLFFERKTKRINQKNILPIILLGFFGYYFSSLLNIKGLQYVSVSTERMLVYLFPSFVFIIKAVLEKKKPTKQELIALLISYLGILIVYQADLEIDPNHGIKGMLYIFVSIVFFSFVLVFGEKLIKEIGSKRYTAYTLTVACLFSLIHYFLITPESIWFEYSLKEYVLGVCLALFGTVIPIFFISMGIELLGATRMSMLSFSGPFFSILLGIIILQEAISLVEGFGIAMILIGIYLFQFVKKRTPPMSNRFSSYPYEEKE